MNPLSRLPATLAGWMVFFLLLLPSAAGSVALAIHYEDAHMDDWGPRGQVCLVGNQGDLFSDGIHITARRKVTVTCPGEEPYEVVMSQPDSTRTTTSVWHNSRTKERFTAGDASPNAYGGETPPTGTASIWLLVLSAVIAAVAGVATWYNLNEYQVRARKRRPRARVAVA